MAREADLELLNDKLSFETSKVKGQERELLECRT